MSTEDSSNFSLNLGLTTMLLTSIRLSNMSIFHLSVRDMVLYSSRLVVGGVQISVGVWGVFAPFQMVLAHVSIVIALTMADLIFDEDHTIRGVKGVVGFEAAGFSSTWSDKGESKNGNGSIREVLPDRKSRLPSAVPWASLGLVNSSKTDYFGDIRRSFSPTISIRRIKQVLVKYRSQRSRRVIPSAYSERVVSSPSVARPNGIINEVEVPAEPNEDIDNIDLGAQVVYSIDPEPFEPPDNGHNHHCYDNCVEDEHIEHKGHNCVEGQSNKDVEFFSIASGERSDKECPESNTLI